MSEGIAQRLSGDLVDFIADNGMKIPRLALDGNLKPRQ